MTLQEIMAYAHQPEHDATLLRAIVQTLSDDELQKLDFMEDCTNEMQRMIFGASKRREPQVLDEEPQYRDEDELAEAFWKPGKRCKARAEIRVRLPYLSYTVQHMLIMGMLHARASDRVWTLNYLNKHWREEYEDIVEKIFLQHHETAAAKVLCNHGNATLIEKHWEALANAYYYIPVRLRLPKDFPIDSSRISGADELYLASKLGLEFSEEKAREIAEEALKSNKKALPYIIRSLGRLGFIDTLQWLTQNLNTL